jgi:hypothetical protein
MGSGYGKNSAGNSKNPPKGGLEVLFALFFA